MPIKKSTEALNGATGTSPPNLKTEKDLDMPNIHTPAPEPTRSEPAIEDNTMKDLSAQTQEPEKLDPFDPAALRLSQDFGGTVGVEKMLTIVPVQKPNKQHFFRVHPDEAYKLTTAIIENKEDKETLLVTPNMWDTLEGDIIPVTLVLTINRQGKIALWPLKLPSEDRSPNRWHVTAIAAAAIAEKHWIRVVSDMALGANEVHKAIGNLPEPEWPDLSFKDILKVAFGAHCIDSPDHPMVQRLQGRI